MSYLSIARRIQVPSLLLVFNFCSSSCALAQSTIQEQWKIVRSNDGTALQAGPDPNDPADLTQMLNDAQVRTQLELIKQPLSKEQLLALDGVRKNFVNSLSIEEMRQIPDLDLFLAQRRSAHAAAIDELLLPRQLARLKQIALRIELAIVGYSSALDCGRLGELANVYDNQKNRLYDRATQIKAETELEEERLKRAAEERVLALLSEEQRQKFRLLAGEYFALQNKSEIQSRAQGLLETRRNAILESQREGK